MGKRKQKWDIGDVFVVQTKDGKYVLGQVIAKEPDTMGSVTLAFFDVRFDTIECASAEINTSTDRVISVVFSTPDLLNSGDWQVVGTATVNIPKSMLPYEDLRGSRFIGAKIIGSGIMVKFLDAYFGIRPWNDWHDPNYLDSILISPDKKPPGLVYKKT